MLHVFTCHECTIRHQMTSLKNPHSPRFSQPNQASHTLSSLFSLGSFHPTSWCQWNSFGMPGTTLRDSKKWLPRDHPTMTGTWYMDNCTCKNKYLPRFFNVFHIILTLSRKSKAKGISPILVVNNPLFQAGYFLGQKRGILGGLQVPLPFSHNHGS